ncbi:alpha-galactosidase, partial [Dickeya dianthicola]|nr:alpha-galactosidase [Dickeya dianthicola]
METTLIRLASPATDVIVRCWPAAEILYWGPHLAAFSPQDAQSLSRPVANGRLDVDVPVTLAAETGRGLFGSPGIEGHRNGLDAFAVLTTVAVRQPDPQQLVIEAEDSQAGLRLTSELRLHADSGVLQLRHCLTN